MIPLGAGDIPSDGREIGVRIAGAINEIIKESGWSGNGHAGPQVSAEMVSPDLISELRIDLTALEIAAPRTEKPAALTKLGAVKLGTFELIGDPIGVYQTPVNFQVSAREFPMAWARDDRGKVWLAPVDAANGDDVSGSVDISAAVQDIKQGARLALQELANQNGAKLKDFDLRVESAGPRSLLLRAEIAAAKFMMTAKLHGTIEVSLDDEMNLRVDRLDVQGDGAAGSMVLNMFSDKIAALRGKRFALAKYGFAGAALNDVHLEVDDRIRVKARFGRDEI